MEIIDRGFELFRQGRFDDGGSNLYVTARGEIERIHRTDLTGDGHPDIVIPNTHGHLDRGPTRVFRFSADGAPGPASPVEAHDLPNDSGWMSRVVDLDGDGHPDLVVINGENGVTSELPSYVYWGGPDGLTGERTELPTAGAYDVLAIDADGERASDGLLDLVIPSAWTDHHNPAVPRPLQVWRQAAPRRFEDASGAFVIIGVGALSVAAGDLTGHGRQDLVVANYRSEFDLETDSFLYPARPGGGWSESPIRLPTRGACQVRLADLDGDGRPEAIFAGGDQVRIYWNGPDGVRSDRVTTIAAPGMTGQFRKGALAVEVADVDGDGQPELLIATRDGVEVRRADRLDEVASRLEIPFTNWLDAVDLNGDGRPELIVSVYEDGAWYEANSLVLWNGPQGLSVERSTALAAAGTMGCTAGDLDGDGQPEVILNSTMQGPTGHWTEFPVFVYPSDAAADRAARYSPERRIDLPSAGETYAYVMADLDQDGHAELVLGRLFGLRIFRGGPGGPRPDDWYELPLRTGICIQVHVADLNRDGWLDLIALCQTYDDRPETRANSTLIFWGGPDGYSADRSSVLETYSSGAGYLADFDGDGHLDLVTAEKTGELVIHRGGPDGLTGEQDRIELPIRGEAHQVAAADLDRDGYLDLIVGIGGHYARSSDTILVLWGGPEGYSAARSTRYDGAFSPGQPTVADLGDGEVSLIVPAYSSAESRTLPWEVIPVQGRELDIDRIRRFQGWGSCHVLPLDLDADGWTDLVVSNHRRDTVHDAEAIIYWGGPEGISEERTTHLPGWGPHYLTVRDPGNALDRGPTEWFVSRPMALGGRRVVGWEVDADVPDGTELRIEVRIGHSRAAIDHVPWRTTPPSDQARLLQYRAGFTSVNGARSPRLRGVRFEVA